MTNPITISSTRCEALPILVTTTQSTLTNIHPLTNTPTKDILLWDSGTVLATVLDNITGICSNYNMFNLCFH